MYRHPSHEGKQTEILEKGPTISEKEGQGFLDHYRHLIDQVEVVAISGSLPAGLPVDYYASLVKIAREAGNQLCSIARGFFRSCHSSSYQTYGH